ncbi:hypothetical protein TK90_2807 (plasmid) [Thioalkalivibrio sp. K90mix]|uniref:hypothetical protein n=1 Tax=Thioalkalivibrio sp. (strain K90mix) TaxID=396595 RepID=UPI000195A725|nr:hypothetical protein [Thioalkalivibrio sp. K90mix]ADC73292.1 hypothetical protein TK90_2807 [Thioalkalivibrio sp. K90mix]
MECAKNKRDGNNASLDREGLGRAEWMLLAAAASSSLATWLMGSVLMLCVTAVVLWVYWLVSWEGYRHGVRVSRDKQLREAFEQTAESAIQRALVEEGFPEEDLDLQFEVVSLLYRKRGEALEARALVRTADERWFRADMALLAGSESGQVELVRLVESEVDLGRWGVKSASYRGSEECAE